MKKILFSAALLFGCLSFQFSKAQVRLNVNVNIGSQPAWGPTGYDYVENYYLPDIDVYYNVPTHEYVYLESGHWVRRTYLPSHYSNYDFYRGYKVVVNDSNPWYRHRAYHKRYYAYRGRRDQVIIRDSHEEKYRDHWDNGHHNGWEKGRGNPHRHDGDRDRRDEDHHDRGRGHGDHGEKRGEHDRYDNPRNTDHGTYNNGDHGDGEKGRGRGSHDDH